MRSPGAPLEALPHQPLQTPQSVAQIEVDASAGLLVPAPATGVARVSGRAGMMLRLQYESLTPAQRGGLHIVRRSAMRDGHAVIEISFNSQGSEISSADARAARTELAQLNARQVLVLHGDYTSTDQDLSVLEARSSNTSDAGLDRGIALLNRGEYAAARAAFDEIIAREPDSEWALANRGMTHVWDEDFVAAETDFARALAINPGVFVAYQGRGVIAMRQQRYEDAVSAFSTAMRLEPENTFAQARRAGVYVLMGNFIAAESEYRQLLAGSPGNLAYRAGLAFSLAELERRDEAQVVLAALMDGLEPSSMEWEDALMARSLIAAQIGLFELAIEDADQMVRTSDAQVPVLTHRCRVLAIANRNLDQARRDCAEARRLDGRYDEIFAGLGLISFREGNAARAVEELTRALRRNAVQPDILFVRGLAYEQLGDTERAESDFAAARNAWPSIERTLTRYGFIRESVAQE